MVYNDKKFKFDPEIKQVIAANIRKFRLEKGYTQEQLAVYYRISVVLEKDVGEFFKKNNK